MEYGLKKNASAKSRTSAPRWPGRPCRFLLDIAALRVDAASRLIREECFYSVRSSLRFFKFINFKHQTGAGKCDRDKKPSYCSKECQKADWKNHKPFCIPGAACSVIDDSHEQSLRLMRSGPSVPSSAISVPVSNEDGSTSYLSSSTIDPELLKDMAEVVGENRLDSVLLEFHALNF